MKREISKILFKRSVLLALFVMSVFTIGCMSRSESIDEALTDEPIELSSLSTPTHNATPDQDKMTPTITVTPANTPTNTPTRMPTVSATVTISVSSTPTPTESPRLLEKVGELDISGGRALALSADASLLAIGDVTADQGDVVYLLDINTGELVQTLKKPLAGLSGTRAMAFSPDDVYLAAGGYQMAVYIWNVEWGARVYDLPYPDMGVLAIDFSADSSFIAAGSAGEAGGVMLWDLANEQVIEFPFPVLARDLEFMPNSSILAVATADYKPEAPPHGPIVLWNIEEGTTESILFGEKATALTFTENGELLAAKIDGHLRIWNIPEGKEIDVQNDNLSEWVWRLEWSADGYVAALVEDSINDHTVLLWNEDGRFITHFTTENVKDFVFISGNRLVMSVPRKPLQIYQIQAP